MTDFADLNILRCCASLQQLPEFQSFVQERAQALGLPAKLQGKLALVLEELTVNVMHYAYPEDPGALEVQCLLEEHSGLPSFCVQLRDWGKPFNPLSGATPDTELSLEDRPVGGLGIFLAREMADRIRYERESESNVLTFCFNL